MHVFQCQDCLTFHLGIEASLVPKGLMEHQIAEELTRHVQKVRGYGLSIGGYHTSGSGFWLSAAYWPQAQIFVLRSRGPQSALNALQEAFQSGVISPPDPGMLNPSSFLIYDAFLKSTPPVQPTSLSALLGSSSVSRTPKPGYRPVTLAAYQSVSQVSIKPPPPIATPAPEPARAHELGNTCPACGETVREKTLLTSTYLGCGCD